MAKVVTSQGLSNFVSIGQPTETIANDATQKRQALAGKLAATDGRQAPSEAPSEPAKAGPEAKAAETATPPVEADDGLEPEDRDIGERARKRISKKHAQMKAAEEARTKAEADLAESERFAEMLFNEREELRKKVDAQPAKEPPKPPEPAKAPDSQDPRYYDEQGRFKIGDFTKDVSTYAAEHALETERKGRQEAEAKRQQEAADAEVRARISKATEKYPDWEKVVTASPVLLPNECLRYLAEADYGWDLAYKLAKEPAEAARIKGLKPMLAVAELAKMHSQFEAPAKPAPAAPPPAVEKPTGAPAPITPISTSGTGTVNVDPTRMTYKELRAWHKERQAKGLERH